MIEAWMGWAWAVVIVVTCAVQIAYEHFYARPSRTELIKLLKERSGKF